MYCLTFFFYDTASTEIYTLSLHDALPICTGACSSFSRSSGWTISPSARPKNWPRRVLSSTKSPSIPRPSRTPTRSEEHTSELQSQSNLVCRLLLEKKKKQHNTKNTQQIHN